MIDLYRPPSDWSLATWLTVIVAWSGAIVAFVWMLRK